MELGLRGKTAIVAASSQGLGKAAAISLAMEGANVVFCSRSKEAVERVASEIGTATGSKTLAVVADVSRPDDITRLVDETRQRFGAVHILVNNAGGPPAGHISTLTDDDWQRGVEHTLMSTIRLSRAVLPMMETQQWGRIITILSIAATQPINDLLVSSTIRPGLLGMAKVLSNQYAHLNITVNSVCPGFIMTNRQIELMKIRSENENITMEQYIEQVVKDLPIGRMGRPEEIGDVIAFLASERAGYITGENIIVDGGMAKGL